MKKIILLLSAAACICSMYCVSPYHQQEREAVELIHPQVSDIRDMVVLQGTIIDPSPIRLYADGSAVVKEILVKPGQQVRAGQLLIRLERTEAEYGPQEAAAAAMLQFRQALEAGDLEAAETLAEALVLPQNTPKSHSSDHKAYELYSPVDCMVMEVRVSVDEIVTGLLPCLVLCDPCNLQIEVQAEENTVGMLREDMLCEIEIPAFQAQKLEGKVEAIMPYARQTGLLTGSTSAKTTLQISVVDSTGMKPGYRAEVKVITAYKNAALLVPYEAVSQDEKGMEYVMLLEQNTVVRRDIQTGSELDDRVEVLEGITPQDLLLLLPDAVQEGAFIEYDLTGSDSAGS